MDALNQVELSLNNNKNLNSEIRSRLKELVSVFYNRFPNCNLNALANKLKTVDFKKIGKFERRGNYDYDVNKNLILLSNNLLGNYDIDHILMKAIIEMTVSTEKHTGFNSDNKLYALNKAYTEILANNVIGNDGDSDLEEEMIITNLLSYIIGNDVLFNSYFSNDGNSIIKSVPADSNVLERLNRLYMAKLNNSLGKTEFGDLIIDIGDLFSKKIVEDNYSDEKISSFEALLISNRNVFNYEHMDLLRALLTVREGNEYAKGERDKRLLQSSPISSQRSFRL